VNSYNFKVYHFIHFIIYHDKVLINLSIWNKLNNLLNKIGLVIQVIQWIFANKWSLYKVKTWLYRYHNYAIRLLLLPILSTPAKILPPASFLIILPILLPNPPNNKPLALQQNPRHHPLTSANNSYQMVMVTKEINEVEGVHYWDGRVFELVYGGKGCS
jgi:hypothetical protein